MRLCGRSRLALHGRPRRSRKLAVVMSPWLVLVAVLLTASEALGDAVLTLWMAAAVQVRVPPATVASLASLRSPP